MTHPKKDPILSSARTLMRIMQFFCMLGMFALAAASIAALIFQDAIMAELVSDYPDISGTMPYLIAALLMSMIALIGLLWIQLNRLQAVVATVDEGNPFLRINGERLRLIAILIFVQQFIVLAITPLIVAMQSAAGRYTGSSGNDFQHINIEISFTTILVALLLIVLGRVFEQGADMQDELEGTV